MKSDLEASLLLPFAVLLSSRHHEEQPVEYKTLNRGNIWTFINVQR